MSCPQEAEALLWFRDCVEKMEDHHSMTGAGEQLNAVKFRPVESTPGDR